MSRRGVVVGLVLFVVGFAQVPGRAVGPGLDHLPGDLGDARFNNYVLEHGTRWLADDPAHRRFWHPPFHHPARWAGGFSDTHLGSLPVYAAGRAAGADPERAFQLWFLALSAANFGAGWWAARRLGGGPLAAGFAAYLFAFGLPAAAQLGHAQLVPRCFVPPGLLFGWWAVTRPGWRPAAGFAGCLAAQTYCTVYLGAFLAAVAVLTWLASGRLGNVGWRLPVALAVAVVALAPLVVGHLRAAREYEPLDAATRRLFLPDAAAWVRPPTQSLAWGWLEPRLPAVAYPVEKRLFVGGVGLLGLAVGLGLAVRRPADDLGRYLAAATLAAVVIACSITAVGGVALADPLLGLPGVSGVRAVGRVVLVLAWPLGLAAGAAAEWAAGRWPRFPVAGLAVVALLADQALTGPPDTFTLAEARERRQQLADRLRGEPGMTAFYVFPGDDGVAAQLDAMWAGLALGVPTVNGWTGYPPTGWHAFRSHGDLLHWLRTRHPAALTPDRLAGLRTVGPLPPPGNPVEVDWRAAFHRDR